MLLLLVLLLDVDDVFHLGMCTRDKICFKFIKQAASGI
jgi:hypothetical protein